MKVLFLCVANSARSQLAEGLARKHLPDATLYSAGSRPGKLNPYAVEVMREVGLDISGHRSKAIEEIPKEFLRDLDWVITLCAEEVCPVFITKAKRLHWPVEDPAIRPGESEPSREQMLSRFRTARETIDQKLRDWRKTP